MNSSLSLTQNELRRELDLIFDHVDDLLLEGKFPEVDQLLEQLEVASIHTTLLIGYLSITLQAAKHLIQRADFFHE